MQSDLIEAPKRKQIEKLWVVRNFRRVIENRDISLMKRELYQFLNLHCGFIAHYDINGFKATYARTKDFAEIFIPHFDRDHKYFTGIYACHQEPYKDTGFTKAEIKEALFKIVDMHKDEIAHWSEEKQRDQRYGLYLLLKMEFGDEPVSQGGESHVEHAN